MITGVQSLAQASLTTPLPRTAALQDLYDLGALPRAGQFIVIFGEPGCGKSTFMEHYVNDMDVSCLYISADTDATDTTSRLAAMRTGMTTDAVKDAIKNGGFGFVAEAIESSKIHWVYDSSPDMVDVNDELSCFIELYDEYPTCIVIDNAMNIDGDSEDEQGRLRESFMEFRKLSRETGITVFALHHAREDDKENSKRPPSRARLQGKVSQLPDMIWGVALDNPQFYIAPVKVRDGKSDASGSTYVTLDADPSRAMFKKHTYPVSYQYGR